MNSQNAEEKHILEYFGDHVGTFIDIGANDGATLSNTRALALKGWCGVFVEPSPMAFARLKALYSGEKKKCFYLHNCALGNHNGTGILFDSGVLLNKGDVSLVSTMKEEETNRFRGAVTYQDVEVKVFKWKTFLNRLYIKQFDFISIDAEGFDLDILTQIDLSEVKLVCIEHNGNQVLKKAYMDYMEKFGITNLLYESPENILVGR